MLTVLPVLLGLFLQGALLWGQSGTGEKAAAGTIVYASGGPFEVVRDGIRRSYDPSIDYVEGTELRSGDYINTYKGAFLEIVLEPGDTIVKVSEQTSLVIPDSPAGRETRSISLTYGRVRARIVKLAEGRSFEVRGPSMVAGVRGTDFGYDLTAPREETDGAGFLQDSVYCFEGSVMVEDEEARTTVDIGAGEMAVKTGTEPVAVVPLSEELIRFWQANQFVTSLETREETDIPEATGFSWNASSYRKAAAVTGISGAVLAAAAASVAYLDGPFSGMSSRDGVATGLAVSGGIFISTAVLSLILAQSAD